MKALEENKQYKDLLKEDPVVSSVLTNEEIDECFTLEYYMKNVDYIFNRLQIK
jgi:adenylosuccinate lyase